MPAIPIPPTMRFVLRFWCFWIVFRCALSSQCGALAQFRTPLGDIDVELFDADKPVTVQNFMQYVRTGHYTNMIAHRWVPGFVIQGGGFFVGTQGTSNVIQSIPTFATITNEFNVGRRFSNSYGTLAMARVGGLTNSASSQWFFNLANNVFLDSVDGGFTVFGRVVGGTNVLNRFNSTAATNGIFLLPLAPPLDELPVLSRTPSFRDLVFVDITLLNVQVRQVRNQHEISWLSVSNRINRVEFTTSLPPTWQTLFNTNANGSVVRVIDSNLEAAARFYRVRVEY